MRLMRALRSLGRLRARRRQEAKDASLLMELFGDRAYDEARRRSRESDDRHWRRVRAIVAERTGRTRKLDTATRYLEE